MNSEQFSHWQQTHVLASQSSLLLQQPLIMGILNTTPDSFSDGGQFLDADSAYGHAMRMIENGADLIDIGGESSKPGALAVTGSQELARVIPVIERIHAQSDICISIDTTKVEVMSAAVAAGASIINDISALQGEGALAVAADLNVAVCLMHMQGVPQTMQDSPCYTQDVVDAVNQFFQQRLAACMDAGIARERIILDPGFGFGKSVQHNLQIIKRLREFQQHKQPLLLGVSRKSTLGAIGHTPVNERLHGGIAATVFAALQGVAIIRTHDVNETRQALQMVHAIVSA